MTLLLKILVKQPSKNVQKIARVFFVVFFSVISLWFASQNVNAAAPTISRAFYSKTSIISGSIVRLTAKSSSNITTANTAMSDNIIGVTESNNESLVAIGPSSKTVQVAISGEANTLVTTVNGNILRGKYVAVSPFGGMGMASKSGDRVIGVAEATFNSKSAGAKRQTVTNRFGQKQTLWVGRIPVNIATGVDNSDTLELNGLQKIAMSITGHTISTFRVIVALILIVLAFATIITIIYSSAYGSIISIGRNPLAKGAIVRSLRFAVAIAAIIAILTGVIVFFLLN